MKAYIILVSIYYYVLLTSGTEIKRTKELNESLHIHCPCQDTLMCTWYHNNQLLANQWEIIPNKTDLIVPANDWSVYGVTIGYCASKNHTYVITNPGMCVCTHDHDTLCFVNQHKKIKLMYTAYNT